MPWICLDRLCSPWSAERCDEQSLRPCISHSPCIPHTARPRRRYMPPDSFATLLIYKTLWQSLSLCSVLHDTPLRDSLVCKRHNRPPQLISHSKLPECRLLARILTTCLFAHFVFSWIAFIKNRQHAYISLYCAAPTPASSQCFPTKKERLLWSLSFDFLV